jgi:phosphocarrier protein
MSSTSNLLHQNVTIVNDLGLHARAAAKLAKTAIKAENNVWLEFGAEQVDAKQVIDILMLAAGKGDTVTVRIEQNTDAQVLDRIIQLINDGFGE